MTDTRKPLFILSMSFVVTGNMLGAGVLALPVKTGLAGFLPSVAGIVLMWVLMLSTAMVLAAQKSLTESETADLPTFFQKELGTAGKWVAVAANLVILYGLLTAYISGSAAVLESLFEKPVPLPVLMLLFAGAATAMTLFGMNLMRRGNAVVMVLMWIAFGTLVAFCARRIDAAQLRFTDWHYLPASLPVVVTAFHFHNIIPSLCRSMNHDPWAIRRAMFLGTFVGLVMNLIWVFVVLAALPLEAAGGDCILEAFRENLPATVPLAHLLRAPVFTVTALVFALLAMTAAYMANGTALSSFLLDLNASVLHTRSRILACGLAFAPPLIVSVAYPDIFLKAIDLVGGVGIDVIFGILPGVILIRYGRRAGKVYGGVLVLLFSMVLAYEIIQEFHLADIHPLVESFSAAEYWKVIHPR